MNQQSSPQVTERRARIVHAALVAGVLVLVAAFVILRQTAPVTFPRELANILRYVGVGQLLLIGAVISRIRARIPAQSPDDDMDVWWAANLQRVLIVWALAESTAILGGTIWFLTADPVMMLVLPAAIVLLLRLRPSSWSSGPS